MDGINELLDSLQLHFGSVAPTHAAAKDAEGMAVRLSGLAVGSAVIDTDASGSELDR